MIGPDPVPEATAPPERHADFLELCVLRSPSGSASAQEYIRDLRASNATEMIADSSSREDEVLDDQSEGLVQAAFDEVDGRRRSFAGNAHWYPFESTGNALRLRESGDQSLYTFLALLSRFGKDAGPKGKDGEKIFEEVSARAAEVYLGGPKSRVRSVVFGFPRRVEPKGFADALDGLCRELGEGRGAHRGRPKTPDQKDAKLDIVAWVEFDDRRQGKLITFGQCATGMNWTDKVSELPAPADWCGHWMTERPSILPLRTFFVPHRVEWATWTWACTFAGLLFDRCRIASLASESDGTLRRQWSAWSAHVLQRLRPRRR